MTGRGRLPLLILLVVGFVAVVALVAHGRPLAASAGHGGVPTSFWSYAFTTAVIVVALGGLFVIATLLDARMTFTRPQRSFVAMFLRSFIGLIAVGLLLVYFRRHIHPGDLHLHAPPVGDHGKFPHGGKKGVTSSGAHFVWLEAVIVFGLLAVSVAVAAMMRRGTRASLPDLPAAPEAVAAALDDSLDDLRTDPDLRRAIVAAYAGMERALGAAGLPRHPSETPLEYLERALGSLDTSGPSVRRLTDLFEWAKFSHHEPEPEMRDEAVDALMAVRDELRASVEVPA